MQRGEEGELGSFGARVAVQVEVCTRLRAPELWPASSATILASGTWPSSSCSILSPRSNEPLLDQNSALYTKFCAAVQCGLVGALAPVRFASPGSLAARSSGFPCCRWGSGLRSVGLVPVARENEVVIVVQVVVWMAFRVPRGRGFVFIVSDNVGVFLCVSVTRCVFRRVVRG